MVALNGNVYIAWSSNENGGPDGKAFLDIRVARATYAAGPRIVAGTSGVVTTTDASGTPQAQQFDVTFDRPVDPSSFTGDDVTVIGKDANGNTFVDLHGLQYHRDPARRQRSSGHAVPGRVPGPDHAGHVQLRDRPEHQRPDLLGLGRRDQLRARPRTYDARTLTRPRSISASPRVGTGGDNGGDPNNNITRSNIVVSGSPPG